MEKSQIQNPQRSTTRKERIAGARSRFSSKISGKIHNAKKGASRMRVPERKSNQTLEKNAGTKSRRKVQSEPPVQESTINHDCNVATSSTKTAIGHCFLLLVLAAEMRTSFPDESRPRFEIGPPDQYSNGS
ncbi:unnamed protein product [Calypogeia fissa]